MNYEEIDNTIILPLSIIFMFIVTKWWYAIPVDGSDKLFWGFPFAFMGEGFHTSMSLQFFVLEFLADFLVHFSIILLLVLAFTKWFPASEISKLSSDFGLRASAPLSPLFVNLNPLATLTFGLRTSAPLSPLFINLNPLATLSSDFGLRLRSVLCLSILILWLRSVRTSDFGSAQSSVCQS